VIEPDGRMEVRGRGVVTVFDGSDVVTTAYTATGTQPLMLSGVRLHTLPRGAVFDLHGRKLISAPGLPDVTEPPRVLDTEDVPEGTRPRSRRIAAEGAHETTEQLRRRPDSR
jgi:cyanophycinase